MTRRGLTLFELLLSLALASTVVVGATAWSGLAARLGSASVEPARWRHAATTVLTMIGDDLLAIEAARGARSRVERSGNDLRIETRASIDQRARRRGPCTHMYRFRGSTGTLELVETDDAGRRITRTLLTACAGWQCRIDEEREQLLVRIERDAEIAVERRYPLP